MTERAKVRPHEPQLRVLAHAQQVIDVGRYQVTAGLRAQRVALQVQGSQASPVGVIATRCGAFAMLIERSLAVPLLLSAGAVPRHAVKRWPLRHAMLWDGGGSVRSYLRDAARLLGT